MFTSTPRARTHEFEPGWFQAPVLLNTDMCVHFLLGEQKKITWQF